MNFQGLGGRPSTALDGTCGPHSVGPSAQNSKKAGFNHAGGGTPAHCLRVARPAEADQKPKGQRHRFFSSSCLAAYAVVVLCTFE